MTGDRKNKRVAWLFDGDHLTHPFICIGVQTLMDAGYPVSVVDRAEGGVKTSYDRTALNYPHPLYAELPPMGRRAKLRAGRFLASMFWQTLRRRPSVIIATLPTAATMGWMAARLLRARLVYYPFELYGEQHYRVSPYWKERELRLLKRGVDAVITQNDGRAKIYVEERGARVAPTIVHNYKRDRTVAQSGKLRKLLDLPADCRIVLYEGELTYGRWLTNLVQSAQDLPDDTILVFMGRKTPWWTENVEPLLRQPEIQRKTRVAPFIPHAELLSYVADADVGIIIYDDQVRNNYYCEPGKLSDYVLADVPVVAPDFPTIAPRIHQYAVGATFTSAEPATIAGAINQVLSTTKAGWLPSLRAARRELIWDTQLPTFLKAVSGA